MTEQEFRADEAAVKETAAFFATSTGHKLLAMLKTESVLEKLSSDENQSESHVRDLAIAESGEGASILLGRVVGYNLALKRIDSAQKPLPKGTNPKPSSSGGISAKLRRSNS